MPSEDFNTIVSHGDWLEALLVKDNPWQLKHQFQQAITLLNLDYELPENDLSLRLIDKIAAENLEDSYTARSAELGPDGEILSITQSFTGKDADYIIEYLKHEWKTTYNKQLKYELFEKVFLSVIRMYKIKADAQEWFEGLLDRDIPWGFRPEVPYILNGFIDSYNGIRRKLIHTAADGFHSITAFTDQPQAELGIPVDVILARVLIDFLIAGGQNYFGFCDECKRFYVSRRSQKKHYCSDVCRVKHYKKEVEKEKSKIL